MGENLLLALLDIAPALFSKYRYVDPAASKIPANHFIIDQLTYDLPLQYTIYNSYRAGEVPWWDQYTYGGRPLLADAHINGTDPLRVLLYCLLPFEAAYNWTFNHPLFIKWRWHVFTPLLFENQQMDGCFFSLLPTNFAEPMLYPLGILGFKAHFFTIRLFGYVGILCSRDFHGKLFAEHLSFPLGFFYSGNLQSHAYFPIFG